MPPLCTDKADGIGRKLAAACWKELRVRLWMGRTSWQIPMGKGASTALERWCRLLMQQILGIPYKVYGSPWSGPVPCHNLLQ